MEVFYSQSELLCTMLIEVISEEEESEESVGIDEEKRGKRSVGLTAPRQPLLGENVPTLGPQCYLGLRG